MNKLNAFEWIAMAILLIGGLNWGLIGFFKYDLLAEIFGTASATTRVIEAFVGLSAVSLIVAPFVESSQSISIEQGRPSRI